MSSSQRTKLSQTAGAGPSRASHSKTKQRPQRNYPVCRYFKTARGCYNGAKCRFLHDREIPPVELNKTCKFFAAGYCRHGSQCWFRHVKPEDPSAESRIVVGSESGAPVASEEDVDATCGICFETPVQFGLLTGCSHAFCLECLRDWRKSLKKDFSLVFSNIIKTCPLCRSPSRYITPSSHFFAQGDPKKDEMVAQYKASMARVPCRYFQTSLTRRRFCPYGYDCFYKHEDEDGTTHTFTFGVDKMLSVFKDDLQIRRRHTRLRNRPLDLQYFAAEASLQGIVLDPNAPLPDDASDGPDPLDLFSHPMPGRYSFRVDRDFTQDVTMWFGGTSAGPPDLGERSRSGVSEDPLDRLWQLAVDAALVTATETRPTMDSVD